MAGNSIADDASRSTAIRAGDTLRVRIGNGPQSRIAVMRFLGTRDEPYSFLDWYDAGCPTGAIA
jgi:hypothetical protein